MPVQAHVASIEALETFRAHLVVYLSKARPALEDAAAEIAQMRTWLEHDRRPFWENELRRRRRRLEEAQQELFSARLSSMRGPASALQMAVHRAEHAVHQAEDKLVRIRRWCRDFSHHAEPWLKQLDQLHGFLTTDLAHGVAQLAQSITALEAYAALTRPGAAAPAESEAAP